MIQKNLFTKQKQTQRFQNQTSSYQRGNTGGRDKMGGWGRPIALPYVGWMGNRDLL